MGHWIEGAKCLLMSDSKGAPFEKVITGPLPRLLFCQRRGQPQGGVRPAQPTTLIKSLGSLQSQWSRGRLHGPASWAPARHLHYGLVSQWDVGHTAFGARGNACPIRQAV